MLITLIVKSLELQHKFQLKTAIRNLKQVKMEIIYLKLIQIKTSILVAILILIAMLLVTVVAIAVTITLMLSRKNSDHKCFKVLKICNICNSL